MITSDFSVKGALKAGWELTKQHWVVMIGLYLGFTILCMIFSLFMGTPGSAQFWIMYLIEIALSIIFTAGYYKMYLNASLGEEPEFAVFGQMAKRWLPFLGVSILFSIAVCVGLVLLIVPGIWIAVRFGFAYYLILDDEQLSIADAFRESYRLTNGYALELCGLLLASILILFVGFICLIVGILPAFVEVSFAWVCALRMLQNKNAVAPLSENKPVE